MTNLHLFSWANLPVSPWRNGGGETREILSWPVGKADFTWRASIATISNDGPFSVFEGIDRSITLLTGHGVYLRSEQGVDHHLDQTGVPFAFAGEVPIQATLIDGVTTDFNIMTRRGMCTAQVQMSVQDFTLNHQRDGLLYVLRGSWQIHETISLQPTEGVYWSHNEQCEQGLLVKALQPDSQILWVEIAV